MSKIPRFQPGTGSTQGYEDAEPFLTTQPLLGVKPVWLTAEVVIALAAGADTTLLDERFKSDAVINAVWVGMKDFRDVFGTQIKFFRNAAQINFPTTFFPYLPIGQGPLDLHPLNLFFKQGDELTIVATAPIDFTGQTTHEYIVLLRGWFL